MRNTITMLTADGLKTLACCCGHGVYSKTIVIKRGKKIIEFFTDTVIPRKRNFYKRDKEGLYYIPEVENNGKC